MTTETINDPIDSARTTVLLPKTAINPNFKKIKKLTIRLAILSLSVCIAGNFQQAYLLSILNQPYLEIRTFINDSIIERSGRPIALAWFDMLWSGLNVTNPIAAIVGQLLALWLCNRFGRRRTAIFSCILSIPGLLISFGAKWAYPYFELLFIGRFIWGTANGIITITQTVWIIESAPVSQRGRVSSWQETIAIFGNLATQAIGIPLSTHDLWPMMFVLPLVMNLICMVTFALLPESPQYLLFFRRDKNAAKVAISQYHGMCDDEDLEDEIARLERNGRTTDEKSQPVAKLLTKKSGGMEVLRVHHTGIDVMFRPWKANDPYSTVVRRGAWVGVMVKIAYVFTGARCIRSYNTFIYHEMGNWSMHVSQWGSMVNSCIRLPLSIVPIILVERVGRRPLLIITSVISCFCLTLTFLSIMVGDVLQIGTLVGIALLLCTTSMGIGSLSRFYAAELVPRQLLLKTMAILSMIEALLKIIIEFSFYPLATATGAYSMLIFLLPTVVFTIAMVRLCPETKGKTINAVLNGIARKQKLAVSFQQSARLRHVDEQY